jgi:mRNA (2'-O-methyladenosine-N6-)-methyltransferase
MRLLPIPSLSAPTSLLFLWVTARAIELGRDLVAHWGFKRVDEIVWAKTNQVGKLIRTGRTGHWLKSVLLLLGPLPHIV